MDDILFMILVVGLILYLIPEGPFECSDDYKVGVVQKLKTVRGEVGFTEKDAKDSIARCCDPLPRCTGSIRCLRPSYC